MKSTEYRTIITTIIKNISKKRLPGVKEKHLKEIASEAAKVIHARMYGANVDNVDSPIWRDYHGEHNLPNVEAQHILDAE